jgi:hypothetical protein
MRTFTRRRTALALLALLLLAGGWRLLRPNRLAQAQALQKQLAAPALAAEQRKAAADQFRQTVRTLSDAERAELVRPQRERMKAELDRYFALSAKDRKKYLDERINADEAARKARTAAGTPPRPGPAPGGPGGANGPGGRSRDGTPLTPDQIEERRKQMLARTTPEERAAHDRMRQLMTDLNKRRQERGLPPAGLPGFGGGRGRPG